MSSQEEIEIYQKFLFLNAIMGIYVTIEDSTAIMNEFNKCRTNAVKIYNEYLFCFIFIIEYNTNNTDSNMFSLWH